MGRELIVEVIALKKSLYQAEHDLHLRGIAIEEEFQFADEERQFEKEKKLLDLEAQQLQVQLKLKRAHLFGLRLAKGKIPYCIACFVEDAEMPEMVRIEPRILGTSLFKCSACGHELKTEP
jgi:predicted metal-binding protein